MELSSSNRSQNLLIYPQFEHAGTFLSKYTIIVIITMRITVIAGIILCMHPANERWCYNVNHPQMVNQQGLKKFVVTDWTFIPFRTLWTLCLLQNMCQLFISKVFQTSQLSMTEKWCRVEKPNHESSRKTLFNKFYSVQYYIINMLVKKTTSSECSHACNGKFCTISTSSLMWWFITIIVIVIVILRQIILGNW